MSTMDIQAMQSMDWLFKKERIYLLAQFWQQRATLAEKEVSALKEQLANTNQPHSDTQKVSGNSDDLTSHRPTLDELSAKDKEISQLVEDVHKLQTSIGKLQETTANQIARLEEELSHRKQHILRLEARLESQRDYEDVKRQLNVLKAVDKRLGDKEEISTATSTTSSTTTETDRLSDRIKSEIVSQKRNQSASPPDLQGDLVRASSRSSTEQNLPFPSGGNVAPPPGLQNVEQFGSFLGEEIVANWRRSLERTIISQSSSSSPPNVTAAALSLPPSKSFQLPPSPTNTSPVPHSPPENESHKTDYSHDAQESSEEIGQTKSNAVQCENSDKDGPNETISRNDTPKSMDADSPAPSLEHHSHRGDGMTPCKSPASSSDPELISNNNSPHLNNNNSSSNNNIPAGLINGLCGINMGLNNNLPMNFDMLKSQFRFEDPRSPFRFGDDPGSIVGRYGESLIPKGDPMEARLQEMLRYNIDKYSTQNLDTLHIARRVRELLSIHNVGQRLFAKYVLGLSQGTVSELLSKPKPWDKLTEKGRDSYRKMHAWACDENAILLLKSLIPKKGYLFSSGKDPGMPNVFSRGDSDMTEERIAHILSEATQMMNKSSHNLDQDTRSNDDSKSPNRGMCASPVSRDGLSNRKLKKYEHDDVSHDQVVRIYQEELAKLMGRRLEDHTFPGFMFPPFFGGNGGSAPGNSDDIRMSLDAYHRELAKLQNCPQSQISQNMSGLLGLHTPTSATNNTTPSNNSQPPMSNGIIQDLSLPKNERKPESVKLPNGDLSNDRLDFKKEAPSVSESISEAIKHAGSAFSLVRPKTEPSSTSASSSPLGNSILPPEDFSPSASVSPLQRMASITNSLISQPPTPHHHAPSQRPLKAVLPPITQQQFDQFNNLNTEEIVRKVKEQLSQFSISQRLFGESVLGLSQGSVSDLLARPKPWHMLTQKGREPFIRMKMFLEDDNAVHKLVASQYKIAPEKLMRTGGYGGPTPITPTSLGKPIPPTNCGKVPSVTDQLKSENSNDRSSLPHHSFLHQGPPQSCNVMSQSHNLNALRNIGQHISPSVYEMAALTQELDTQIITTKIKEALLANNIGQKIFGEAVLGLSQGSVSELLSKPKPWHMLSIKGREPFIRMQLWLSDSHNIERLQALKSERRELSKRRRGSGQDNSSDTSSNDTSEFYSSSANSPPSAAKKQRVLFSEEQKEALKLAFALDPYPSVATIEFLANELGLASRTITNWFHNHRMRLKQQSPHANEPQMSRESPGNGFDPVQFRLLLNQRLGFSALSLPFPNPYFPPNPELAALMSRNIIPTSEQLSGLDLSLKRDMSSMNSDDEDEDMDNDSHLESDDSGDETTVPEVTPSIIESRSSRRKPAAPQWVNPDWQEESEVIINGVCIMQTDDFPADRQRESETVHIEPKPAVDGAEVPSQVSESTEGIDETEPSKSVDAEPEEKIDFKKDHSNSEDSDDGETEQIDDNEERF
ncbi:homeobox protein cut isoform X2 [Planococcus citri]|uniref:homeobox protein cut isoform X2 n=1 Tax=Planococcus citri TaxID=170843 RepID=UPI0031F7EBC4